MWFVFELFISYLLLVVAIEGIILPTLVRSKNQALAY